MERVIIVWDRDDKFFQNWTEGYQGDGIAHGMRIAAQIGGSYCVVAPPPKPRPKNIPEEEVVLEYKHPQGTPRHEELRAMWKAYGMSGRVAHRLALHGLETVEQAVRAGAALRRSENFGRKSLNEIKRLDDGVAGKVPMVDYAAARRRAAAIYAQEAGMSVEAAETVLDASDAVVRNHYMKLAVTKLLAEQAITR